MSNENKQAPSYTPIKVIGNGAFGKFFYTMISFLFYLGYVFQARDNNRNINVALKRT